MSCQYCKNKTKNDYIVQSNDRNSGVDAKVIKNDGIALLAVSGWFDGFVGIEPCFASINYCPICGERLVSE